MPEEKTIIYRDRSNLPMSPLPGPEHPLIKAGFSPQLPTHFEKLNRCLSLIDTLQEEQQLKSMTLELTPDPNYPRLTIETQYEEQRQTRLTVFPDGKAMLTIIGKAPYEQMPDLVGAIDLLDMQNFVKQQCPGLDAALFWVPKPDIKPSPQHRDLERKEAEEPIFLDFLLLTEEDFSDLEGKWYTLSVQGNDKQLRASLGPYRHNINTKKSKCWISYFEYRGKAQNVEKALVGFINLLERNPPGKL